MVLGNEHITHPEHAHPANQDAIPGIVPDRGDRIVAVQHRPAPVAPQRLHAHHRALLSALIAHLMPVDDGSTVQAEIVLRYIDWLIASEGTEVEVALRLVDLYSNGCDLVQAHAGRVYGRQLQAMSATEQDQLVWDMLEGSMDGFDRFSPAFFFNTLRRHIADAMQGGTITQN